MHVGLYETIKRRPKHNVPLLKHTLWFMSVVDDMAEALEVRQVNVRLPSGLCLLCSSPLLSFCPTPAVSRLEGRATSGESERRLTIQC